MSIQSLTSRDMLEARRLVTSRGTAGGQVRTYTTAARGSLPTTDIRCRIQPLAPDERREYGVKGEHLAWRLLFHTNPSLTVEDHVFFTDADGNDVEARITVRSKNADGQSRIWSAVCEEFTGQE